MGKKFLAVGTILLVMHLLSPALARAQLNVFDDLVKNVSGLMFSVSTGSLTDPDALTTENLRCFGLETLIDVYTFGDTLDNSRRRWGFELGLGYEQVNGLTATEPSMDLRGKLTSVPVFSLYGTYYGWDWAQPFIGLHGGKWNFAGSGIDSAGARFRLESEILGTGVTAGVYKEIKGLSSGIILKATYHYRVFQDLKWTVPQGEKVPRSWPITMDASGFEYAVAWQFDFDRAEPKPKHGK